MKKCPKSLSLVLMTSLAIGGLGCSNEPTAEQKEEFRTFSTVGECIRSGAFTDAQCEEEFKLALAQTPKFTSLADCEQTFGAGNCGNNPLGQAVSSAAEAAGLPGASQADATQADATQKGTDASQQLTQNSAYQSGGSWMPLMAGFMMGRMLSGGNMYRGSQPLFRDTQPAPGGAGSAGGSTFRTATGDVVKPDAAGRVSNPGTGIRKGFQSTAKPVMARGSTTSRSGFGSSSGYGTSSGS